MGRRKIKIEKIPVSKNRTVTFNKRKFGVMKKAMELSVLCECDITLVVNAQGKMYHYTSNPDRDAFEFFLRHQGQYESLTNQDFIEKFDTDTPLVKFAHSLDKKAMELGPKTSSGNTRMVRIAKGNDGRSELLQKRQRKPINLEIPQQKANNLVMMEVLKERQGQFLLKPMHGMPYGQNNQMAHMQQVMGGLTSQEMTATAYTAASALKAKSSSSSSKRSSKRRRGKDAYDNALLTESGAGDQLNNNKKRKSTGVSNSAYSSSSSLSSSLQQQQAQLSAQMREMGQHGYFNSMIPAHLMPPNNGQGDEPHPGGVAMYGMGGGFMQVPPISPYAWQPYSMNVNYDGSLTPLCTPPVASSAAFMNQFTSPADKAMALASASSSSSSSVPAEVRTSPLPNSSPSKQ
jgi:hypothetical protein